MTTLEMRYDMSPREQARFLLMMMVYLLRSTQLPDRVTRDQLDTLVNQLRSCYTSAGQPYGDDETGFQRWLRDQWPAPPMA